MRQVRDKICLAAIFAPRHQSVSSGPLGMGSRAFGNAREHKSVEKGRSRPFSRNPREFTRDSRDPCSENGRVGRKTQGRGKHAIRSLLPKQPSLPKLLTTASCRLFLTHCLANPWFAPWIPVFFVISVISANPALNSLFVAV